MPQLALRRLLIGILQIPQVLKHHSVLADARVSSQIITPLKLGFSLPSDFRFVAVSLSRVCSIAQSGSIVSMNDSIRCAAGFVGRMKQLTWQCAQFYRGVVRGTVSRFIGCLKLARSAASDTKVARLKFLLRGSP
jgi:hypothetical protein